MEYAVQPDGELGDYIDIPRGPIPNDLARQLNRGYYAAISYMDAQLGKATDEFDRLKMPDNPFNWRWP
jgi:hypothetical protein